MVLDLDAGLVLHRAPADSAIRPRMALRINRTQEFFRHGACGPGQPVSEQFAGCRWRSSRQGQLCKLRRKTNDPEARGIVKSFFLGRDRAPGEKRAPLVGTLAFGAIEVPAPFGLRPEVR